MATKHIIEYRDGIAQIRFREEPAHGDFEIVIDELAERDIYDRRLWDFTEVSYQLSESEIVNLAEYGKAKFRRANMMAIVAPKDLAFGLSRVYEAYRTASDVALVKVFRQTSEAITWLSS